MCFIKCITYMECMLMWNYNTRRSYSVSRLPSRSKYPRQKHPCSYTLTNTLQTKPFKSGDILI